ncbi:hypothetical protein Q3O97_15730 [Ralstonia pseudosolanacearum]|uniref:hypothetical protein n=1 Tax=Ralstonia pseudosolanacearum TaxID=1310165 RepID=UPI002704B1FC|nr:hypothetical protein [Ralstonia pseudosolanacearum]MDO3617301.1 hypothetical protein [Ralstonia pseudosolanacearum]
MNTAQNLGISKLALSVMMAAVLTACGGGGGGDGGSTASNDGPAAVTTTGVAALGAPIIGGSVMLKCTSGTTASATTAADGTWSASLKTSDYPCAVRVVGGQANGKDLASALHSVAVAPGTANITPLTDIIVGVLGKQDPDAWFNRAKNGDLSSAITSDNLNGALAKLQTALITLPGKPTLPNGFNPLNSAFKAEKGDAGDNLLETYGASLTASGLTQTQAAVNTANGQSLTKQAYVATAFTTPGLTAIRLGSSVNLDGTFAIAIADPNRGQYVAKASIDSGGNVTSFTDAGSFTGVVSTLGNRVGQLCTANGVGAVVANQPSQYVYVSSDMVEVTNLAELSGLVFSEYEDCRQSGTTTFDANGNATFTSNASPGQPDAPVSIVPALTDAGRPDPANHSVMHAKVYKYTTNGITKYAYLTVNSTTGTDSPLTFDTDTKYVTIGVSQ